jgi:hypothetical protein
MLLSSYEQEHKIRATESNITWAEFALLSPPFAEDAQSVPPDGSTVQSKLLFYQPVYLV